MPLFKDQAFINDRWHRVGDDEPLLAAVPIVVSMERLLRDESEYLFNCGCELGVEVSPDQNVEALERWMERLSLISLSFPTFADGRAYSQAQTLRFEMGFEGEIRAKGDVLVDQRDFMQRCGFSSFEIEEGRALVGWQSAKIDMALIYQGQGATNILQARHRA